MELSPRGFVRSVGRVSAAAQNALEIARFGGLGDAESTPYEVVDQIGIAHLRRYASVTDDGPNVVLVPPLMLTAEVWDVSPQTSAVGALARAGAVPWVIDFGSPEAVEGGLSRTLTQHVTAVSGAVDAIRRLTGRDVHLAGYSQGGMFCYQAAAYRRSDGVASVVTFGSPVDVHRNVPFGLPEETVTRWLAALARTLFSSSAVPSWMTRTGFKLLDPVKTVRSQIDFLLQLHDRELLIAREPQRRFLDGEGFIAWPGPALAEFAEQFVAHNRMLSGGFVIDERLVTLADIVCPILAFVGEVDEIAKPVTVRAIRRAAPDADVHEVSMHAGHFGLVVGSRASDITWPTVAGWVDWVEQGDGLPDAVVAMREGPADTSVDEPAVHVGYGIELATSVGLGVARSLTRAAGSSLRTIRGIAEQAAETLPRLVRLERVEPDTRISLGSLLDEQARSSPEQVFFLFGGRGFTYLDAKRRIDNVVRGLVHIGVRQGEHVGVLMGTRPTALALIAALSRLGAVAVLLRPDDDPAAEAALGEVTRVILDPEHIEAGRRIDAPRYVLGGGGHDRELADDVTDMERIDPDVVELPSWYRANPGRARDLAFVLFTGRGEQLRTIRISNRRWSLSAFAAASAADLDATDTVYAVTPIHHPSGLMTAIGSAVAGGARVALTETFDADTFWEEVRRYGVTIVPYTWTLCQDLLAAPRTASQRHHPIRLFMGSGMPVALWRQVVDRFPPAGVLEFYASTEGRAVLGNLTGKKVGSKGRPLPGSATVRIIRWDVPGNRLVEGPDGFATVCDPGEVGMLVSRAGDDDTAGATLRGIFAPGDRWFATGDLFLKDDDGDYWLADHQSEVVVTTEGPVFTTTIEDALGHIDAVSLAAVYETQVDEQAALVAAVVLRPGGELDEVTLDAALADLAPHRRPLLVWVADALPRSTWFRIRKPVLREQGVPVSSDRIFERAAQANRYRRRASGGPAQER